MIRQADNKDIDGIMNLYHYAQIQMIQNGNPDQWGTIYPTKELILQDINKHQLYVIEEKEIIGVFVFIIGEDPTYKIIQGKWLNNDEYGVIHRIASSGKQKGILEEALKFCESRVNNIRIDTHEKNKIMQHLLEKNNFIYCGIITIEDGSSRLAYQKVIESK